MGWPTANNFWSQLRALMTSELVINDQFNQYPALYQNYFLLSLTLLQKGAFTAERAENAEYFYGFIINEVYFLRFG